MSQHCDSLQVLSRLDLALRMHDPIFICYRQPVCKCILSNGDCMCDSDECFEVAAYSFDLLSNCKSQFLFRLKQGGLKCTKQRHLRIFYLDAVHDDVEVPLIDIDTTQQRARIHDTHNGSVAAVDFPLDCPPTCQLGSLIFNIGYLEFDDTAATATAATATAAASEKESL
jgi:hypothetical protein